MKNGMMTVFAFIFALLPMIGIYLLALAGSAGQLLGVVFLVIGVIYWALVFGDFGKMDDTETSY